jgi:hypothetical protein
MHGSQFEDWLSGLLSCPNKFFERKGIKNAEFYTAFKTVAKIAK